MQVIQVFFVVVLVVFVFFNNVYARAIKPYYFELEDRRLKRFGKINHNFGKKSHLLGTTHNIPLAKFPKALQRHMLNHNLGILENDKTLGSNREGDLYATLYDDWKGRRYLREPGEPDCVAMLSPAQQQQLFKCAQMEWAEIVKPQGIKVEGRNIRLKLSDLNARGLLDIYTYGSFKFGMDQTIRNKTKYVWSIDAIASTWIAQPTINVAQPYLHDPFLKLSPLDKLKHSIDNGIYDRPSFYHNLYWQGMLEQAVNPLSLNDPVVKTRNLGWAPHLVKIMSNNNHVPDDVLTFGTDIIRGKRDIIIAVGADHLIGEYGLLKLLQKQGYLIKRARENATFDPYMPALDEKGRISKAISTAEKVRLNQTKVKAKTLIQSRQKVNAGIIAKAQRSYRLGESKIHQTWHKLKKKPLAHQVKTEKLNRLKANHLATMELLRTKTQRALTQTQQTAQRIIKKATPW